MKKIRNIVLVVLLLGLIAAVSSVLVRYVPIFKTKLTPASIEPGQIRLEIINASGIDKQGRATMEFLRKIGFDVYGIRTAQKEIEKTTIVDRVDSSMKNAKAAAKLLAKKKKVVFFMPWYKEIMPVIALDIDSTLYLEATIILGKDYQQFIPKNSIIF
jgi:hypothetical protein